MFLPQPVRVSCIFCAEFFTGHSCRPLETRVGLLYLPPPLMYWVPLYMLNSSKFPEDSTVHSQYSPYTLQGTASTPPQMSLVTPELLFISWMTYLGEHHQISWKVTNLGKSLECSHSSQNSTSPCRNHNTQWDPQWTDQALQTGRNLHNLLSTKSDGQHPTLGTNCCTGVVYDNLSVVFMHWTFSINNKVGLVSFANIYWRHQSVLICRRWSYSLISTWNWVLCIRKITP